MLTYLSLFTVLWLGMPLLLGCGAARVRSSVRLLDGMSRPNPVRLTIAADAEAEK